MEVVRMHNCEIWIPIERWVFVTYKFSWLHKPQEKYSHQKSLQGCYQATVGSLLRVASRKDDQLHAKLWSTSVYWVLHTLKMILVINKINRTSLFILLDVFLNYELYVGILGIQNTSISRRLMVSTKCSVLVCKLLRLGIFDDLCFWQLPV
jgi:hypothetical protein